jgi:hypothetical protein
MISGRDRKRDEQCPLSSGLSSAPVGYEEKGEDGDTSDLSTLELDLSPFFFVPLVAFFSAFSKALSKFFLPIGSSVIAANRSNS